MVEGLEVVIKYRGEKYNKVAAPATSSAEFAILKKDLAHLRVHSPSQKNVRRVNGSFILHWPTATANTKVDGLTDSLYTRWFKLCSNDPEARKLRELLSIDSITLAQNGGLICSSMVGALSAAPQDVAERLNDRSVQQPPPMPAPPMLPPFSKPSLSPREWQARFDGDRPQPPHLKRRLSGADDSPNPPATRQKLDTSETQTPSPVTPLQSINVNTHLQLQQNHALDSLKADQQLEPPTPGDTIKACPPLTRDDNTPSMQTIPLSRESGEVTPLPVPTPVPVPPSSGLGPHSGSGPGLGSGSGLRPPALHQPSLSHTSTSSLGSADSQALRRRDRDRLIRELWDTRRQITAIQAREKVILDDLERLGERPDRAGSDRVTRDDVLRLEVDLKAERARRVRAEQTLSDVERECRAPFVVPALFQAFVSISELSN